MNKDKLIQLLEHELVQADAATTDAAFEKHIYAIHALTALYTGQETSAPSRSSSTVTPKRQASTQVTDEEIRMMGGKYHLLAQPHKRHLINVWSRMMK